MKNRAFIYIILAGMLWGTSGLFVHFLAPFGLNALQMASIRGTVSAVCMVLYALIKNKSLFRLNKKQLAMYTQNVLKDSNIKRLNESNRSAFCCREQPACRSAL